MQCTEEPLSCLDFYFIFFCMHATFVFCSFSTSVYFSLLFYLLAFISVFSLFNIIYFGTDQKFKLLYLFIMQLNIFAYKRSHRGVSRIVVDALLYSLLSFVILPSVSI